MKSSVVQSIGAALLGASGARAWQFPQSPGYGTAQRPLGVLPDDSVDISYNSGISGLTTYANIPYVSCFTDDAPEGTKYDIAILGAPFDTSVTGRPGTRYGPRGIRTGSQRQRGDFGWSAYTGRNPLRSWATVMDCGDVPLTFLDNNYALAQLTKAHKVVSGRKAANETHSVTPRIITLGGDHTTTLPALRSVHEHWGKVSVIHFDSHLDTWDPAEIGGGISDYAGLNHGTFLHIAHEEGLIRNSSIHAGIRAPLGNTRYDVDNDVRCGFARLTARDLDRFGTAGVVSRIREHVVGPVYITVDIDVLDPAFAPATGTAEPGGWSTRELLTILDGLAGLDVVGADVVEVAPAYDSRGETTTLAAAEVVWSLLEIMVETPVKSLSD
ncbi:putative arginase family protein [Rosellinia necatrix]|uniref:Putative arginase family protein n=1 Tax=Rosellinia necatrix TaxID=77044 RepID=A0A1W2TBT2_ROSNE|nr:putative arginase family protein [Rosellinia necatrix]